MKKTIALLLAVVMCLSLAACGGSPYEKYEKYADVLDMLENGDYDGAISYIQNMDGANDNTEESSSESSLDVDEESKTGTSDPESSEAEDSQPEYKTVELTLDNWQEYFEFRPKTNGAIYSNFDEFERLDYVNWAIFLKDDVADKVTKMDDVAIEYYFTDGYLSWFEYNLDTEEFVKKNAAAEGEVDGWIEVNDSKRDVSLSLNSAKNGAFLVFISRHLSDSLNDNIYSFIGEAYGKMEMTRIKGTLTITE